MHKNTLFLILLFVGYSIQSQIISKDFNAANTYQFNIKKINQILELYEQKKKIVIEEACAKSTTVK